MTTTAADTKAMVLAYIKLNWFQGEHTIARALDLDVRDVGDALVELERTDKDVVERGGIIGYIGHTDRCDFVHTDFITMVQCARRGCSLCQGELDIACDDSWMEGN